jgi:hypothetical protein
VSSLEPWDDGAADFAAAVLACRDEDSLALSVLARHGDRASMLAAGIKLFSEALDEGGISGEHFRLWSQVAVRRPGSR